MDKEKRNAFSPFILPLFEEYQLILSEQQIHYSKPIFYNKNNKQLNPRGLHKIFKETLDRAGLPAHRF